MAGGQRIIKPGIPKECSKCGAKLIYTGLGEYECEECHNVERDDYGKVRSFLEENRGATLGDVARATGVSKNRIREFLLEERIEVTAESNVYMHCEVCGAAIRSGRRCPRCEEQYEKELDANKKASRVPANMSGHGKVEAQKNGEMRFVIK